MQDSEAPLPEEQPLSSRNVTDYGSSMVQWMRNRRPRYKGGPILEAERPSPSYIVDMVTPTARITSPVDTIPAKHLHSSVNKERSPVNVVRWTPDGRRLLTGLMSGEFTVWNGTAFNFETLQSAHQSPVRQMKYSHSDDWLLSADQDGNVKYFQTNLNNVKEIRAHDHAVRDLAFAPTDVKFVTASDDATLKVWDFAGGVEELTISGHNWDVKCCDWHPTKGLIVSGSKDNKVKLWDPRNGRCLTTLHGHKNQIQRALFQPTRGELLATCARDSTARIFDLRMMRDIMLLKGHEKDIATLTWHPMHPSLLSTGGWDGSLFHYLLSEPNTPDGAAPSLSPYDSPDPSSAPTQTIYPAHRIPFAHDFTIWSLDWHPLGHILASGSNDRLTRFWTRARPGDTVFTHDRYHIGQEAAEARGTYNRQASRKQQREAEEAEELDEEEGLIDQQMPSSKQSQMLPGLPGLPGISATSSIPDGMSTGGAQTQPIPGMAAAAAALLGQQPQQQTSSSQSQSSMPGLPPLGMPPLDPSKLQELLASGKFPHPLPIPPMPQNGQPGAGPQFPPVPPPGGFPGFPPGAPPPPHLLPPGFPMPVLPGMGSQGQPGQQGGAGASAGTAENGGVRKRGPLPSQAESLQEEMRRGKYTRSR
ncbi:WD40 repeat-like protein [Viridothelium virens]|uniref:Polyadenylation factor subunit 2 n=1 Tax=Viridothelium virens TaxID=1048519 RepID=A0A6A6GSY9_VIRVR|nr:WD40 repeat-like protein [Viridothelium virens]